MEYPATFELPTTDTLTGLLSSPYFRYLLREKLLPQAETSDAPLTLFLFDIDDFSTIYYAQGREVCDRILLDIAAALKSTMPDTAVLARYGADEFGGALPDTRLDDAFTLMEELRRRIAALALEGNPDIHVTCSAGLAAFPAHGKSDVELVREADQALYVAKTTGRNKVALPLADSRMVTKTSHYTATQLERLAELAKTMQRNEASILREALDDVFKKYTDRLEAMKRQETGNHA